MRKIREVLRPRRDVPLPKIALPDFAVVHRELDLRSVTRALLWEEYPPPHETDYGIAV